MPKPELPRPRATGVRGRSFLLNKPKYTFLLKLTDGDRSAGLFRSTRVGGEDRSGNVPPNDTAIAQRSREGICAERYIAPPPPWTPFPLIGIAPCLKGCMLRAKKKLSQSGYSLLPRGS